MSLIELGANRTNISQHVREEPSKKYTFVKIVQLLDLNNHFNIVHLKVSTFQLLVIHPTFRLSYLLTLRKVHFNP